MCVTEGEGEEDGGKEKQIYRPRPQETPLSETNPNRLTLATG